MIYGSKMGTWTSVITGEKIPGPVPNIGKRTKLVYLLGKSETELLGYDEYDAVSDGTYYTDNPVMAEEYTCKAAFEELLERKRRGTILQVYLWEIADGDIENSHLWLQFSHEDALEWHNRES